VFKAASIHFKAEGSTLHGILLNMPDKMLEVLP
jgi:hypothetical protein